MTAGAVLPGDRQRSLLRRIFWACIVVLLDIRIGQFDLLIDTVGYLMIAIAAAELITVEPTFRSVNLVANVSAVFALRQLVPVFSAGVSTSAGSGVNVDQPVLTTDLEPVSALFELAAAIAGWLLVWFLLTALAGLAGRSGHIDFLDRAQSSRRWSLIVLIGGTAFGFAASPIGTGGDDIAALALVILLITAVVGVMALKVVWDAADLPVGAVVGPAPSRRWPIWARGLAVLGALVAIGAVVQRASVTASSPSAAVEAASAWKPPGLVTDPDTIELDPSPFGQTDDLWSDGSCAGFDYMTGIDLESEEIGWLHEIPRPPAPGVATLGDTVLAIDPTVGSALPTVAAIDAASGDVRWQRYFAADVISLHGTGIAPGSGGVAAATGGSPDTVAIVAGSDGGGRLEAMVLDPKGAIVDEFSDDLLEWDQNPDRVEPGFVFRAGLDHVTGWGDVAGDPRADWRFATMASPTVAADGTQAVIDRRFGEHDLYLLDTATGELRPAEPYPVTSGYNRYGNAHSPGSPLQIGDRQVVLLMGSESGADSKVLVFDTESGQQLWSREHVRSAAAAGSDVLYDTRNDAPYHELVTRTLHLVDGEDPDNEHWSVDLSVNSAGGNGYLGTIDEGLVFLVEDSVDGDPLESFLVVTHGPGGAGDLPEVIRAGGRHGGGPGVLGHVDGSVMAAAGRSHVVWQRRGHEVQRLPIDAIGPAPAMAGMDISALTVVGDTLVVHLSGPPGCDGVVDRPAAGLSNPDEPRFSELMPASECHPGLARLTAVDLESGTELWSRTVPAQPSGLSRLDGSVIVVDPVAADVAPSIVAFDPADGAVRWQRHIDGRTLNLVAVDEGPVRDRSTESGQSPPAARIVIVAEAWSGDSPSGRVGYLLDTTGGLVHDFPTRLLGYDASVNDALIGYAHRTVSGGWMGLLASPPAVDGQAVLIPGSSVVLLRPGTNDTPAHLRFSWDDEWWRFGNPVSPGVPLQVGDGFVLLVLGSDRGPDSKVVVWNTESRSAPGAAEPAWTREHLRSVAAAGDRILYDKRNDEPADAVSTRDLFLVESGNPDEVVWSTRLAVNDAGGNGYLGTVGDDLVFLVEGPGSAGSRFLRIDGSADSAAGAGVPDLVSAAGSLGGGGSPASLVSDELLVAGGPGELVWQWADGPVRRLRFGSPEPVVSLVVIDGVAVAERGGRWADHNC